MTVARYQTLLCTHTRSICSSKTPVVGGNLLLSGRCLQRDTCNICWEVPYKHTQSTNFNSCVTSSSVLSFISALTMFLSALMYCFYIFGIFHNSLSNTLFFITLTYIYIYTTHLFMMLPPCNIYQLHVSSSCKLFVH